jgi:hypothetical protein
MRQFNMAVPRTFYVDEVCARETLAAREVQKVLPSFRPASHLYEYAVDEEEFSARLKYYYVPWSARARGS